MSIELFIAICAALFTFYQAWLARHHNRLSVQPHLQWSHARTWKDDGFEYRLMVENYGLGPARIKKIELLLNKEAFVAETDDPIREIVKKAFQNVIPYRVKNSSFPARGYMLKAQSEYPVISLSFPGLKEADVSKLEGLRTSIDLRIEYESMYGDARVLDTRK